MGDFEITDTVCEGNENVCVDDDDNVCVCVMCVVPLLVESAHVCVFHTKTSFVLKVSCI